jgi:HSP20 family protein
MVFSLSMTSASNDAYDAARVMLSHLLGNSQSAATASRDKSWFRDHSCSSRTTSGPHGHIASERARLTACFASFFGLWEHKEGGHMAVKETDAASTGQKESDQGRESQSGNMQRGNPRQDDSQRRDARIARRDAFPFTSPFTLLQRFFNDDVLNLLDDFGGRRSQAPAMRTQAPIVWMPKVDVMQRNNELVVRADLPGVKPDDVTVEISDDVITISGERKQEHVEENGSVYRFERTYGTFYREIPLPEGAIANQAKAAFNDGVLEITVPAPPEQVSRGRRLEISRGDNPKQGESAGRKEGA